MVAKSLKRTTIQLDAVAKAERNAQRSISRFLPTSLIYNTNSLTLNPQDNQQKQVWKYAIKSTVDAMASKKIK